MQIDFPASADLHRTTVKTGFDEELDILKREFAGIDSLLNQASRDLADTIPQRFGLDLNVVFYPQLGFLICVPIDGRTGRAEWEGGSNPWEKIFVTPGRVYYKDSRMRGFDMRLGDMHAKICGA
jgi:DNA mismatch repair protein MSH5